MFRSIHPAVCMTAGFFLILLLQCLNGPGFWLLALLVGAISLLLAKTPTWRTWRRMRFILLALFILFAWQTPGSLMWPQAGVFSPSREGVLLALEQSLRLLAAASVLAVLLVVLDKSAWMNGLHSLMKPLVVLGVSVDRFILRLRLVLDHLAVGAGNWREILMAAPREQDLSPLRWELKSLSGTDLALMMLMLLIAGGWLWLA
ncbi:CbiQ family ECF transporter T component [Uliginosibacterium aquaticum]|nr:CbiQ family ECF transporter T component [Uliginosibacterium aquaticum]